VRVVSLLASGTEIVCGLGAGDALVGRSHECDNPEWVTRLPCCTRAAFDIQMSSREIDAEVRRRLRAGEPLYHVDAELIERLQPDVLISQEHCDVCAVTPGDIERTGCTSVARQVVALSAGTLAGIYDGVRAVGEAIGRERAAAELICDMQRRIQQVSAAVADRRAPTVVMLEWTDPIFAMGNWGPELVEAANGNLLLGEKGEFSRAIEWEAVRAADPEYLIVAPCGYGLERSVRETSVLETLPGWFELKAVRTGNVAFADGNKFFNRSGTTIVETTQIIAEILHGFEPPQSWRNKAWQPYSRTSRHLA
jgi:iron complex transport system substrate-binding protein